LSEVDFGRKAGKGRPFDCERTRAVVSSWSIDLNKLLKHVPPVYHPFYASLQSNDAVTVLDVDEQDFDES